MSRIRYRYRTNPQTGEVESYRADEDWTDAPRSTGDLGKFQYDNLQASDGTDISSRTKHRRYMQQNGLAMTTDFTRSWEKARDERANGTPEQDRQLGEDISRAFHDVTNRRRR